MTATKKNASKLMACVIFFVALNLRPAIIAVGPLLSQIGASLGWGESLLGLLGSLPLLAFAALSFLVQFITKRFDTNKVLLAALVLLAAGCLARSAFDATWVWIGTVVVGGSIAVGNVLAPAIVKRDFPERISMATGAYSAFVTTGSALAGLTAAALSDALGGWRIALAFWAIPALIAAALWYLKVRSEAKRASRQASNATAANEQTSKSKPSTTQIEDGNVCHSTTCRINRTETEHNAAGAEPSQKGLKPTASNEPALKTDKATAANGHAAAPLWKRPTTWLVTLFMGLQSAAFYTFSNWLPTFAVAAGCTQGEAGVQLFIFQILGTVSGLTIPHFMYVRNNQITAGLLASAPLLIAAAGWLAAPQASLLWSIFGGMGQGASLVVALTLISLRGTSHEETVALSGIAQSFGYLLAACGPSVFGALAEATCGYTVPLAFMVALAAAQCLLCFFAGKSPANTN